MQELSLLGVTGKSEVWQCCIGQLQHAVHGWFNFHGISWMFHFMTKATMTLAIYIMLAGLAVYSGSVS